MIQIEQVDFLNFGKKKTKIFRIMNVEMIRKDNLKELKKFDLLINNNLPVVEDDTCIKSLNETADRIDILHLLYTISTEGKESKDFFYTMIKDNNLSAKLSRNEISALEKKALSDQSIIDFSWSKESVYALLWCLGLADNIFTNLNEINLGDYYHLIAPEKNRDDFLKSVKIKSKEDLLKAIDFYYNLHWSYKHAENTINNRAILSLVRERRKALEWYTYEDTWGEVSLDT